MQFFSLSYLETMRHVPEFDLKVVGYGVLCTLAIGAGFAWIIA